MEYAEKVLLTGGILVLTFGFLLGIPMAQERMKAASAPKALVNAHLEALIGGAVLIALAVAAGFSDLGKAPESIAAWLLAGAVASAVLGGTLNWLQKVEDSFASKSPGFYLQAAAGPTNLVGIAIILVGVLKAL